MHLYSMNTRQLHLPLHFFLVLFAPLLSRPVGCRKCHVLAILTSLCAIFLFLRMPRAFAPALARALALRLVLAFRT